MRKHAIKLGLVIVICISLVVVFFYRDYQQFKQTPLNLTESQLVIIAPGSSFDTVNYELLDRGILDNPFYMRLLAHESGLATQLKAGEYEITPGLTPTSLLDLLVSGQVRQYSLTLVEGWNIREVLTALKQDTVLIKTLDYSQTDKLMAKLGFESQSPEGLFFPDTYHFPRGTTDRDFLKRAYQRLQAVLQEEWSNRAENLPYNTPYEALIMASIVEKETGLASERDTIAGVFVRRLEKNMKLQTDPTVIYAMGLKFDGNIRKKDLNIDSPHNTYRYRGLPPTPIALAGREAIHAALNPEPGKALYFVSKGDGSHYFSETLQEHNRAVAKYQLKKSQ